MRELKQITINSNRSFYPSQYRQHKGITMEAADVSYTNDELSLKCPICQSEHIEIRNYAKKTGRTIGSAAGAVAGVAGATSGAEAGATVGLIAGPVGFAVGGIFGAIVGGLVGAAAGGTVGANLGKVVDDTLLENYHCLDCDHTFGMNSL